MHVLFNKVHLKNQSEANNLQTTLNTFNTFYFITPKDIFCMCLSPTADPHELVSSITFPKISFNLHLSCFAEGPTGCVLSFGSKQQCVSLISIFFLYNISLSTLEKILIMRTVKWFEVTLAKPMWEHWSVQF